MFSTAYRERTYDPNRKNFSKFAELCAGVMWWWIGWNLLHDWRHLVGQHSIQFFLYLFFL